MNVPSNSVPRMAFDSSVRFLPSTMEISIRDSAAILTPSGSKTLDLDASCSLYTISPSLAMSIRGIFSAFGSVRGSAV